MENLTKNLKERVYAAFFNWLTVNREVIGENWFVELWNKGKDAEADTCSLMGIIGTAMWMFSSVADRGVLAGLSPGSFNIQGLAEGLDEPSTKRLLALLSSALCYQGLPIEVLQKEIHIISPKHFSLEAYMQNRKERGAT